MCINFAYKNLSKEYSVHKCSVENIIIIYYYSKTITEEKQEYYNMT